MPTIPEMLTIPIIRVVPQIIQSEPAEIQPEQDAVNQTHRTQIPGMQIITDLETQTTQKTTINYAVKWVG